MARNTRFDLDADPLDTDIVPAAPRANAIHTEPAASPETATPDPTPASSVFGNVKDQVLVNGGGVYAQVNENDFIVGTEGADMIDAGAGDDLVYGAGGDDIIIGGDGHDTLAGGNGHDYINAGTGADWVLGEAGNDRLFGFDGNDRLNGGDGADELSGERGADVMTGGRGPDKFFVGQSWYASGEGRPVDIITDFNPAFHGPTKDTIGLGYALIATDFFYDNASVEDAFAQGYVHLFQHGAQGEPGFGTSIWIDSNGAQAGGDFYCVADLAGVPLALLNDANHHAFSIF